MALNERCLQIIDKHFGQAPATSSKKTRVLQWENATSVFDPKTGRLHVHKHDARKSAYQELVFESAHSCANTLTAGHHLKLWDRRRMATCRELARLQGFPETFVLPTSNATDLFGNAVAVHVAAYACKALAGVPRTFVDVCSGVGGFHLAAAMAFPNIKCLGYSEVKPSAIACYEANFPNVRALGDARTAEWPAAVDLLTAGFPCQPFSRCMQTGRKHKNIDFFETLIEAIDRTGAKHVVLENVQALLTTGAARFDALMSALRDRGFTATYSVLNAADFGLPQNRKRVYVAGSRCSGVDTDAPQFAHRCATPQRRLGDILESH